MKPIETVIDVTNFAREHVREGISLHPDNDFNDYINLETNLPTYSKSEAQVKNDFMKQCVEVCENENIDIYDLMQEVLLKSGLDKYIPLPSADFNE